MRPTLALLLTLLSVPLASYAQPTPKPATVRDHLWLFACPPGGDAEYLENAGYRGGSRMTPVEGAHWLDIPNLVFVTQDLARPATIPRARVAETGQKRIPIILRAVRPHRQSRVKVALH